MILNILRKMYKRFYIKRLISKGLVLGKNVDFEKGVNIDANFPWLIKIGNNVILSPWVYILAHDSAGKNHTGVMKIGKVLIEDNVYVGARTTILPGVKIGENSIIGANSVVTRDVPAGSVAAGIPAKVICTVGEYLEKYESQKSRSPMYDRSYTIWGGGTA